MAAAAGPGLRGASAAAAPAATGAGRRRSGPRRCRPVFAAVGPAGFVVAPTAPGPAAEHFTVLTLAIVIGYYVIGKVAHALHTPADERHQRHLRRHRRRCDAPAERRHRRTSPWRSSLVAILASINVFGGFAVTRRMLGMFRKADQSMSVLFITAQHPVGAYLVASLLFILSLAGLSRTRRARNGV